MSWIKEIIKEAKTQDTSNKSIRNFGMVITVALGAIGIFIALKTDKFDVSSWLWGIGLLFLILGFVLPVILRPVYKLWMLLGILIGGILFK